MSHDLRFEVLPDGSFTDVLDWLTDELHARTAINTVANQANIPSWVVDEYKTVGNMLSAMKTADSLDMYTAWWEQYRRSDEVPADVVIPTGEWPIIEVSLCKKLMREAEKDLIANVPLQRERAAMIAGKQQQQQRQQQARQPGAARPGKQQPPPPSEKKKCRICKKVPDDGHVTAKCPDRSGQDCHKWLSFKCNRGADCVYDHPARPAGSTAPAAPAAPATPVPAVPHGAPPPYRAAPTPVPSQSALPAALENFTPMAEAGMQEISCRNTTSPECTPNFVCDLAYWGKMINDKAKVGLEYCLPKSCDNCRSYDKAHRSASMMTGQPSPAPTPEPAPAPAESHENDGANDDYDYYHDYDLSMGNTACVTSAEVEQVNWYDAAHSALANMQIVDEYDNLDAGFATTSSSAYSALVNMQIGDEYENLDAGFATTPIAPKCSIQLLLSDYESLSLPEGGDVSAQSDVSLGCTDQNDVLADIPAWVVAAHAKQISQASMQNALHVNATSNGWHSGMERADWYDSSSLMLVNDIDAQDGQSDSSSEDADTVAQLCSMDSALPTDHARYTLRQFQKFGMSVTPALEEVASLEADNSLYGASMEPVNSTRASCLPDPSGYVVLGDQMNLDLSMDDETAAALMDSPADHESSVDLESSGSDHQIDNVSVRRLKKHYVNAMDKDARELVMLFPTAGSNLDGVLMLSTNADAIGSPTLSSSCFHTGVGSGGEELEVVRNNEEIVHVSVANWIMTANSLNRFSTLGEYNPIIVLITTHLQGFMAQSLGVCNGPAYQEFGLLLSDVDLVIQNAMNRLHCAETLRTLQSDFSRREILEDTLDVAYVTIYGLTAGPLSQQVLAAYLRTALASTIRLVANRLAAIECIPDWSVLDPFQEQSNSWSDGDSSDGTVFSDDEVDCQSLFGMSAPGYDSNFH